MKIIPHSRPTLGQEEIDGIDRVVESAQIAQGMMVKYFEQRFAKEMGVDYAVSTNSGTSALHLVLLAMGIGSRDEVIIPSYVCTALYNAIKYVDASPVLADIDPETYNMDPGDVKRRLTKHTKAIIVPHLFGLAADLDSFLHMNVPIIEDCAQAVGSTYHNKRVGTFGHAAIFSFYATKVMTTGEGGMVVSASKDLIHRIMDLREYDNKDEYKLRYNYKMTDIHAAVGLAQLNRIHTFIRKRKSIAQKYYQSFEAFGIKLPPKDPGHIYYRYVIGLERNSESMIKFLQDKGVYGSKPIYVPLHRYFKMNGYPRTETAWKQTLSIPIYPSLTKEDSDRVVEVVIKGM